MSRHFTKIYRKPRTTPSKDILNFIEGYLQSKDYADPIELWRIARERFPNVPALRLEKVLHEAMVNFGKKKVFEE